MTVLPVAPEVYPPMHNDLRFLAVRAAGGSWRILAVLEGRPDRYELFLGKGRPHMSCTW